MSPSNIHHTLGPLNAPVRILYINPNSTRAFTQETIDHLSSGSRISADVSIDFYTAPADAPPSIDGTLDGVMSTAVILGDLGLTGKTGRSGESQRQAVTQLARKYSAIVVACFSSHPLVPCLKEVFAGTGLKDAPSVVSILEASVHTALQLGPTFGIATTGLEWEPLFDEAIRTLGISSSRYTGTKGSGFNAISLHGDGPFESLVQASVELVEKGAKVIILGCAGMAPLRANIEAEINKRTQKGMGKGIMVVDCVQAGLESAIALSRMRK